MKEIPIVLYKKIHQVMPIVCVDIVVLYKNKILLGKRLNRPDKGKWWLPGGRVLKGETLKHAAIRKLNEETGIKTKNLKELGFGETFFKDGPFSGSTHTVNFVFLFRAKKNPNLYLDKQHSEFKWFENIPTGSHPYVKKFIKKALSI